jgi:SNF2 family DNA or RNA helicase
MERSWSAFCELDPRDQKRIAVYFDYNQELKDTLKKELDARWVARDKLPPGARPFWTVALDLNTARRLREIVGPGLTLGKGIEAWGRDEKRAQRQLRSLSVSSDAKLERVDQASADWLRPYQRADVKHMSIEDVINSNQPGVGKTVETIYATIESGMPGPHIVVCPVSLFKDPWRDELAEHLPDARVLYGDTPAERRGAINFTWMEFKDGKADDIWLLINPQMVRVEKLEPDAKTTMWSDKWQREQPRRILSRDHKGNIYVPKDEPGEAGDLLFEIEAGWVVADEFHKYGLGEDRNTQFARGLNALRKNSQRAAALSGTPTGGKPIRLWGPLNFTNPDKYPAKWKWAKMWLTNADGTGPVEPGEGTGIGGIQPGREEEFYNAHSSHLIRRTRHEALPGMPDKQFIDVWVDMTPKQRKVYEEFVRAAEVEIDGGRVSADGVLAEYQRAKQFANALCRLNDRGEVVPTTESGKLPELLDRLDTFGIRAKNAEPGARAIVASMSQRFVVLVEEYLRAAGLNVKRIDGTITNTKTIKRRDDVIEWYKDVSVDDEYWEGGGGKEARVLVMTTDTGGVGLNLGMTGSIHIMDEDWNPDTQEQLEDRGMRNRTTPLIILYYRTRNSIQEYIHEVGLNKTAQTKKVLADQIRKRLREDAASKISGGRRSGLFQRAVADGPPPT